MFNQSLSQCFAGDVILDQKDQPCGGSLLDLFFSSDAADAQAAGQPAAQAPDNAASGEGTAARALQYSAAADADFGSLLGAGGYSWGVETATDGAEAPMGQRPFQELFADMLA